MAASAFCRMMWSDECLRTSAYLVLPSRTRYAVASASHAGFGDANTKNQASQPQPEIDVGYVCSCSLSLPLLSILGSLTTGVGTYL